MSTFSSNCVSGQVRELLDLFKQQKRPIIVRYQASYDAFYREELPTRQALNFPPAAHMAAVHFRASSEMVASAAAEAFVNKIKPLLEPGVELFGPMPAPIAKVRNQYRYQLMIRGGSILRLGQTLRPLVTGATAFRHEDVDIHVDIDPQSLL